MKKFFLIGCFLLCCGIGQAVVKVALAPASPEVAGTVDQVLAALAEDKNFQFVERARVDALLEERKLIGSMLTGGAVAELGKIVHADWFVIVTVRLEQKLEDRQAIPSALVIYDAQNGFRLAHIALPENPAESVKTIIAQLRRMAVEAEHPAPPILLSIVTVHDAGIPERFKYREAAIAANLEQRLGVMPGVMVLERDYLEEFNQEKQITGQAFLLAPAARLLRLEFTPGTTAETVDLRIRVTDAFGREWFQHELTNCNADPATIEKIVLELAADWRQPVPAAPASAEAEAKRFYREFCFFESQKQYEPARRKLHAAIALNPDEYNYRTWLMVLNQLVVIPDNNQSALAADWKNLALAKEFRSEFPHAYQTLYIHGGMFPWRWLTEGTSAADLAALSAWAAAFRPLYVREFIQFEQHSEFRKSLNRYRDWQEYNRDCGRMTDFRLYYHCETWSAALWQTAVEHLQRSKAFCEKHPDWVTPHSFDNHLFRPLVMAANLMRELREKTTLDTRTTEAKLMAGSQAYIALAAQHPLLQLRIDALQLQLINDTLEKRYEPEAFSAAVTEYCRRGAAVDEKIFAQIGVRELGKFFGRENHYNDIAWQIRDRKAAETQPGENSLFAAINAIADPEEKAAKVLAMAAELRKYRSQVFTDDATNRFFFDLGNQLVKLVYGKHSRVAAAALEMLNDRVTIKMVAEAAALPGMSGKTKIRNAVQDGPLIELLVSQLVKTPNGMLESWAVAEVDPEHGDLRLRTPWTPPETVRTMANPQRLPVFAAGREMTAIAGEGKVYVLARTENVWREIRDLPAPEIMAMAVLDRRLYLFVGKEKGGRSNYVYETILFSCDPEGKQRKLHLSTSRDDKKDFLEKNMAFSVYQMVADAARNRLLFNVIFYLKRQAGSGLWEYNLNAERSCCRVAASHWREIDPGMTVGNGVIYCSFGNRDYYSFDLASNHAEHFFSLREGDAGYCLEIQHRQVSGMRFRAPFFCRPGQLWFGGDRSVKLLTLPDITLSPLIFPPPAKNYLLFPAADGVSALAVTEQALLRITPNRNGK